MIKRTPQEFADFTGCYVAQDSDGSWYLYDEKPIRWSSGWSVDGGKCVDITWLIAAPSNHDWTYLYEPHLDNKRGANFQEALESENNASKNKIPESGNINAESGENRQKPDLCPHQSEVYVYRNYTVAEEKDTARLSIAVDELMANGWKPQGGLIKKWDEDNGYYVFYQAMVRGV